MDISQLMLLIQLQQASSAWRIGNLNGEEGNDSPNSLSFVSMLEDALQIKGSNDQDNAATIKNNGPKSRENYLEGIIDAMGQKYGVDSNLIKAVVEAESGFNAQARSPVGAEGLMQLMPGTASSYGVKDSFDSVQNLEGGTHFLKDLLNRYQGNVPLALAAYNAGPGAVEKYDGIPPYAETQNYVKKIMGRLIAIDQKV